MLRSRHNLFAPDRTTAHTGAARIRCEPLTKAPADGLAGLHRAFALRARQCHGAQEIPMQRLGRLEARPGGGLVRILKCFAESSVGRTTQSVCGLQAWAVWSRDLLHSPISSRGFFQANSTCSLWRQEMGRKRQTPKHQGARRQAPGSPTEVLFRTSVWREEQRPFCRRRRTYLRRATFPHRR